MTNFCVKCGAAFKEGQRFCSGCGALRQVPTAPPTLAAPEGSGAKRAVAGKGNVPARRIILILAGLLLALVAVAIGSAVYVGYRVKQKAQEAKQVYQSSGMDKILQSLGATDTGTPRDSNDQSAKTNTQRDPCSFLTKEEAGEALGSPILQVIAEGDHCDYEAAPVKTPSGGYLSRSVQIRVQWGDSTGQMRSVIFGARLTAQALGLSPDVGQALLQPMQGIGDEAYYIVNILSFRKGAAFAEVDMKAAYVPDRRAVAQAIAQKVSAKL